MPRKPRLWLWKSRGVYMTTIGGRRYNLGAEKEQAQQRFDALYAALYCPTCKRPNAATI